MPAQSTLRRASMAVTALSRVEITEPLVSLVAAPPRLNFAGFCDFCGVRGCESVKCVTRYEAMAWAVCTVCDGDGYDEPTGLRCDKCNWGVTEVPVNWPGAVRAVTAQTTVAEVIPLPTRPAALVDLHAVTRDEWWAALFLTDTAATSWRGMPTDELTSLALDVINADRDAVTELASEVRAAITTGQWGLWEALMPSRDRRGDSEHHACRIFDALHGRHAVVPSTSAKSARAKARRLAVAA